MAKLTKDFMRTIQNHLLESGKSLALVGIMGVGKTEAGKIIADQLALSFREADEIITQAAGKSIAEIFEHEGEAHFRAMELQVIRRSLEETCVLSTGGGAYIQENTRAALNERALVVWLHDDPKVVYERIANDPSRPIMKDLDFEDFKALLEKRTPFYQQAPAHIDCRGLDIRGVAEKVLSNSAEHLTI